MQSCKFFLLKKIECFYLSFVDFCTVGIRKSFRTSGSAMNERNDIVPGEHAKISAKMSNGKLTLR